jgi:RNA polymerase sigma-70 factor (ECF subfamily)
MGSVDELTRLALAAGGGDRISLAAFVRRSQGEVWRLCASLVDRASADDLTQDVYVRAIPALASFRGDSSARTWLLSITRRTCADAIRRRTRRRALGDRLARRADAAVVPDPSGHVDLALLLASLDADRREAFVLTQVLGLSYAEAAEIADCPVGTIRSRVARARADLVHQTEPARGVSRG